MTHYKVRLDERIIPGSIKVVLERLKEEKGIVIKGGVARLCMLEMLVRQEKNINTERIEIERDVKDLDLILIHWDTLPKSREFLIEKEREIREKLGDVISNGILLRGQDIEPVKGRIDKEGKIDENTIKKILASKEAGRDLTINEVVLVSENGEWQMYYTKRCWRDIITGIGMLNAKDSRITRRDLGRIVPSNRGFYRLMRFWVEGKVEKIWLPEWQRQVHLLEMARLQNKGDLPLGANLGRYSLIITKQYANASNEIKRRWITALNVLGFTDIRSFETFTKEQQLLDDLKYNGFEFESEQSFEKIIDISIEQIKQREEARLQRKAKREECEHEFETVICEGCKAHCQIQKCQKCTRYIIVKPELQELLCNEIFVAGNWKAEPKSLRAFPKRFN